MKETSKSKLERFLHALIFELLAIGLSAPTVAFFFHENVMDMGVITIVVAVIALLWNMLYNWIYDHLRWHYGWQKTVWTRVIHAVIFELGLMLMSIPFIMYWLQTDFWHAFNLELGFILFYLCYAYVYNWVYDLLRARYWGKVHT